MLIISLLIIWLLLIFIGIPIGISLLGISIGYFLLMGHGLLFAVRHMIAGLNSFQILAVPLFILTGSLLNSSGITTRLFNFAKVLVGHIPGGLGHVNVLASLFFSGMSGSAMADSGGLGKLEIQAMRNAGYDDKFSATITASSSIIGPLIPPSITMVLYGVVTGTSIGKMFIGGIIPGLLCTISLMIMVYIYSKKYQYPTDTKATFSEVFISFKKSFWVLLTPVVIITGIFSGEFSPTEAAAITVLYALMLDLILYRQLTFKKLWDCLYETASISTSIGTIIAGVSLFGYVIAREQAPQHIVQFFLSFTHSPIIFLIVVNVALFILGAFIESLAIMMLVIPILAPIATSYDISPVHFGIIVVLNLMISILTPPMGMALFIVAQISNVPFEVLAKAIIPWLIPPTIVLILVICFPFLTTFLPNML